MSFLRLWFGRVAQEATPESTAGIRIHMNFSKATETKIELDKKYYEMTAAEVLRSLKMEDKCLVVEMFSKGNGKVIGKRKILDFERPFSLALNAQKGPRNDDIKYKFCIVESDEVKNLSTSQIINYRFKAQGNRADTAEHEPKIEKEGSFMLKADLAQSEERKVQLYLTNQMIYFKYSNDKQRVTHIPLLLIDEISREEATKLIFCVVSAGSNYYFIGTSAETVKSWVSLIQELRQNAQIRVTVQSAEQEIRSSTIRKTSHMLSFRNLTKESVIERKEFRDVLVKFLRAKPKSDQSVAEALPLLFEFLDAYENSDETDMQKIANLVEAKQFKDDFLESPNEDLGMSNRLQPRDSVISMSDFNHKISPEHMLLRDKFERFIARQFEIPEFLEFVFEECYGKGFKKQPSIKGSL